MKFGKCSTCGFTTALLDFKNPEDYRCPNDGTPLSTTTVEPVIPVRDDILKYLRPSGAQIEDDRVGNAILGYIQKYRGVFWFNNHWVPSNIMTHGASGSGVLNYYDVYLVPSTMTTLDSHVFVSKEAYGLSKAFSWGKKRYFGCFVYLGTYMAQNIHIVTGGIHDYKASGNTACHVGFKLINDVLYGTVADGITESTRTLETLTAAAYKRLEVVFTPESEASEARFSVTPRLSIKRYIFMRAELSRKKSRK